MIGIVYGVVNFIPGSKAMTISKPVFARERTFSDLPDDSSANQIHVMYILPSDGVDESLDINGTLARSVATFQRWLAGQADGQQLRLDYFGGALDITFFRMSQTDAQVASSGAYVRDRIEAELISAGFNHSNKIYAVYYGGSSTYSCGGGAWPPEVPGKVSAIYLKGTPPGAPACSTNSFASSEDRPGYLEFAMLHDLIHALGIVATCAPNHTLRGHVSDSPNDLMYAGELPWYPSVLDIGRNDYFKHNNPGCLDLARSPYMTSNTTPSPTPTPTPTPSPTPPPSWDGTANRLAKFSGGTGPLANSVVSEISGTVGIGTDAPNTRYKLDVRGHIVLGTTRPISLIADFPGNGEILPGGFFGSLGLNNFTFAPSTDYGNAGAQVKFTYFNGARWLSAMEYANVSGGGVSTLTLMKNGGNVGVGTVNPQSTLQVNGYVQLALTPGAPPAADCDAEVEYGRMKVDAVGVKLYVCTSAGWKSAALQ
jgi:hypothetical protein